MPPAPKPVPHSSTALFLDWEEALIAEFQTGLRTQPFADLWTAQRGLCVTRKESRLPHFDRAQHHFAAQEIEISIRSSGGTAVPQGPGIWNISLLHLHQGERDIPSAYSLFCSLLQNVFAAMGITTEIGPAPGSYCDGDYNLLLNGKKLAGTSQRWKKGPTTDTGPNWVVLSHAVILIEADARSHTEEINQFYHLAGGKNSYDANVSTSLMAEMAKQAVDFDLASFYTDLADQLYTASTLLTPR